MLSMPGVSPLATCALPVGDCYLLRSTYLLTYTTSPASSSSRHRPNSKHAKQDSSTSKPTAPPQLTPQPPKEAPASSSPTTPLRRARANPSTPRSPEFDARVATSAYRRDDGRLVTVDTLLDGEPLRIASIYAPVDHTERAQFYTDIKPQLNDATIIGAGRVVLREGGCDLGVVSFLVGFAGAGWRVLGVGGVGPVAVHELFDPLCRVLGCPLAVEGGRVDIVFPAVLVGFLFEHVVIEGASGA